MSSQNYGSASLGTLDERFTLDSKTDLIINNGIRVTFEGRNAVTIYNVDVVAEVNYQRSGFNRFGNPAELGTGVQTLTLSQDKAFTFIVDQGNLEDSMMAQEAAAAVMRQVREVSVPNTDIYRIATLVAYAVAASQGATTAVTSSNAYQMVTNQQAALDDALVPEDGRVMFATPAMINLLKRDPEFKKACDTTQADLKKGIVGDVDGLTLVKVPTSWMPTNVRFFIVHRKLAIAPTKFNMTRVLNEVRGIHGSVAEGRRYYDCFIPGQKGTAIRYHKES